MPTNFTPNYNLNQWEPEDRVLRTDFNADNAKLDAAIKAVDGKAGSKADQSALDAEIAAREAADGTLRTTLNAHADSMAKLGNCQIYVVQYTGTGQGNRQSLTFPERPVLVILMEPGGGMAHCIYGTTLTRITGTSDTFSFSISWSGNTLRWTHYAMNLSDSNYYAIAFCGRS